MTREKAIEILRKNRPTSDPRPCGMELCDAVDMAISALRQQDVTDKDVGKMTNADRIRSMSGEELAEFLIDLADDGNLRIREWLQQPAEEDDHDA